MADAIRKLASDPNGSREMGMNGRRYAEVHYNRSELAERLAVIMEAMVARQEA